jgi:hypothetical protein
MAPFDYRAGRPRRLTPEEVSFFERYYEPRSALASGDASSLAARGV